MTQTLATLRAKKKKNGGFTLVELIIVIAIMAALVAVIAPQYIKYVNESRLRADQTTADSILSACKVASTDDTITDDFTVTWNATAKTLAVGGAGAAAASKLLGVSLSNGLTDTTTSVTLAPKATPTTITTYVVTFDNTDKTVKVTTDGWW